MPARPRVAHLTASLESCLALESRTFRHQGQHHSSVRAMVSSSKHSSFCLDIGPPSSWLLWAVPTLGGRCLRLGLAPASPGLLGPPQGPGNPRPPSSPDSTMPAPCHSFPHQLHVWTKDAPSQPRGSWDLVPHTLVLIIYHSVLLVFKWEPGGEATLAH